MPALRLRLRLPEFALAQAAVPMEVVAANQEFVSVRLASVIVALMTRPAAQLTAVRTSRRLQSLPHLRHAAWAAAKRSSHSSPTNDSFFLRNWLVGSEL